jgi:SPP1 family predicted phage head-tail adaptor
VAKDPGYYCHQMRIEYPVNTRSTDHGAAVQEWKTLKTVWCRVSPVSANEQQKATGQVVLSAFEIETRYHLDVTEHMRGVWLNEHNRVLGFTGIRPWREKDEMIIDATGVRE